MQSYREEKSIAAVELDIKLRNSLPVSINIYNQELVKLNEQLTLEQKHFDLVQLALLPQIIQELSATIRANDKRIIELEPSYSAKSAELKVINARMTDLKQHERDIEIATEAKDNLTNLNKGFRETIETNEKVIADNNRTIANLRLHAPVHVDLVPHGNHYDSQIHSSSAHSFATYPSPSYGHNGYMSGQPAIYAQQTTSHVDYLLHGNHYDPVVHTSSTPFVAVPYPSRSYGHDGYMTSSQPVMYAHSPEFRIATLTTENNRLKRENDLHRRTIDDYQYKISKFNDQLTVEDAELGTSNLRTIKAAITQKLQVQKTIQSTFDLMNVQWQELNRLKEQYNAQLAHYQAELKRCQTEVQGENSNTIEHPNIQKQKYEQGLAIINKLKEDIAAEKVKIDDATRSLADLDENLLIVNPGSLLIAFAQKIKDKFREYDINYPAYQITLVRRSLHNVDSNIDYLVTNAKTVEEQRNAFYVLKGMLSRFQDIPINRAQETAEQRRTLNAFIDVLSDLSSFSIHTTRKVILIDPSCKQMCTNLLAKNNYGFFDIPDEDLPPLEIAHFESTHKALSATQQQIRYNPQLNSEVDKILNESKQAIDSLKPGQQDQYKFYTLLLTRVNEAVKANVTEKEGATLDSSKATLEALAAFKKFDMPGAPSRWKKVIGATMMILGILMVAACTFVTKASLGSLAPYSLPGIYTGGTLFLAGAACLFSGRHKGLSKTVEKVADDLDRLHQTTYARPPAYSR